MRGLVISILARVAAPIEGKAQLYIDRLTRRLRVALPDDTILDIEHTGRRNQALGYPGLDENGHIAMDQIGAGTPDGTQFLRDDGEWAVPPGGGGGGMATPASSGLVAVDTGTGTTYGRTLAGTSPISVSNGNGLAGNPTIAVNAATTSTAGIVELATDGETASGVVVQGNDSRLSNSRAPTAHASSHQNGGSDEIATATPAAHAIPKASASGVLDSWISAATTLAKGLIQLAGDLGGTATSPTVVQARGLRESGGTTLTMGAVSGTKLLGVVSDIIGGVTVGTGLQLSSGVLSLNGASPSNTDFNPVFAKSFAVTTDGDTIRGDGMSVTTTGTLSAQNSTARPFTRFTTTTTLSSAASAYTQSSAVRTTFGGTLYFRIKTASSIGSIRFWLGLRSASGALGTAATAGCPVVCLSYDTSVSGNWRLVNKDTATQNPVDSGVTVAADTEYYGYIRTDASGSYLAIAVAGNALPAEVSNLSNFPSDTTELAVSFTLINLLGGTARRMDFNSMYYLARYS